MKIAASRVWGSWGTQEMEWQHADLKSSATRFRRLCFGSSFCLCARGDWDGRGHKNEDMLVGRKKGCNTETRDFRSKEVLMASPPHRASSRLENRNVFTEATSGEQHLWRSVAAPAIGRQPFNVPAQLRGCEHLDVGMHDDGLRQHTVINHSFPMWRESTEDVACALPGAIPTAELERSAADR